MGCGNGWTTGSAATWRSASIALGSPSRRRPVIAPARRATLFDRVRERELEDGHGVRIDARMLDHEEKHGSQPWLRLDPVTSRERRPDPLAESDQAPDTARRERWERTIIEEAQRVTDERVERGFVADRFELVRGGVADGEVAIFQPLNERGSGRRRGLGDRGAGGDGRVRQALAGAVAARSDREREGPCHPRAAHGGSGYLMNSTA
jgi:hypothetical protein